MIIARTSSMITRGGRTITALRTAPPRVDLDIPTKLRNRLDATQPRLSRAPLSTDNSGPGVAAKNGKTSAVRPPGETKPQEGPRKNDVRLASDTAAMASKSRASVNKDEILAARQARKAEAAKSGRGGPGAGTGGGQSSTGQWSLAGKTMVATAAGSAAVALVWHLKGDDIRALLKDTPVGHAAAWVSKRISELVKPWTDPSSDKLLPDWPLPQMPPDTPCPPLLVLDLEGTLLGTVFTRKNGWRSAKRPGLDDFLKEMHQLYEIAVFTDSQGGYTDEWVNKMDPNGYISWRLSRDATKFTGGKHVKDLTKMNRPISRIVIVDDNPDCFSLQPENGILVKKFVVDDGSDPYADTVLTDLAPFLRALATQDVGDFRNVLRPFIGKDSSVLAADYQSKVDAVRRREEEERSRGLGGFVRRSARAAKEVGIAQQRELLASKGEEEEGKLSVPQGILSRAVNVGSVPLPSEKRGGFWKMMSERENERREDMQRKNEAFQRVLQQREERERARRQAFDGQR